MRPVICATLVALSGLGLYALGCAEENNTGTTSSAASASSSASSGSGGQGGEGGQGGTGGPTCVPSAEICDNMDNNCDGVVDEGCDCVEATTEPCYGGPTGTEGVGVCVAGQRTCDSTGKWGDCVGSVAPRDEHCNGADDDCNGMVDDLPDMSCGVGACKVTVAACTNGLPSDCIPNMPSLELCDGVDNDCDQLTDETFPGKGKNCDTGVPGICGPGLTQCVTGVQTCVPNASPTPETCDSKDTDCDGTVDNNIPGTGGSCTTGIPGACSAGTISCKNGVIDCFSVGDATPELCNSLDDNCDGNTDEGNPEGGMTCVTGIGGACNAGTMTCVNSQVVCVADNASLTEICNGIDDQCDGNIDEGNPGGGFYCYTGLQGACADGVTNCQSGALVCNPYVTPMPDVCNGLDDNCNGTVDEGNPGGGAVCMTGKPGICAPGVIKCQGGALVCIQNLQPVPEICNNGKDDDCNGITDPVVNVVFTESFSNAGTPAGWTLGTEWEIGPMIANNCADPTVDTTATADNRAAGVAIYPSTACASTAPHDYYYLTTPVINTAALPEVWLTFRRWLRSDYPPYMTSVIEVYNGTAWVVVWKQPDFTYILDTAWQKFSYDLTMYKNANMQVRWGFNVVSSGSWGQWTVDDVQITDAICN